MASSFWKNEATAAKRRADVLALGITDGSKAPRGTSFTGNIYVSQATSTYAAAAGTLTNKRRPLTFADGTITAVDTGTEQLTITAHTLETGDGPVRFTTTGSLPGGLAINTDYWVIKVDANTIAVAASLANAYANTRINLTSAGSGTNKVTATGTSPQRGIDGWFTYEATQAETNFDGSELAIAILGHATYEAYTTVQMLPTQIAGFESQQEASHTYGDIMRLIAGVTSGKGSDFRTGTIVWKSLDGTKTRVTGTVDASGRLTITLGDLT